MTPRDHLRGLLQAQGAAAVGFARAREVDPEARDIYQQWLDRGWNASMAWARDNGDLRSDPRLLLRDFPTPGMEAPPEGTVICAAFPLPQARKDLDTRLVARFARGEDYHRWVRRALLPAAQWLRDRGHRARICVDSAPIRERYWASRCGVGFTGLNGLLQVPGVNTLVMLGEVVTDAVLEATPPLPRQSCARCCRCLRRCPGRALQGHGALDAHRCAAYLTIEHRGEFSPLQSGIVARAKTLLGCDACQCCPGIEEDEAPLKIPGLTRSTIKDTPLSRPGLRGLRRNLAALSGGDASAATGTCGGNASEAP